MDVEIFNRLKPISDFKTHRDYEKIRKRQREGNMSTYIWNDRIYYDTAEYVDMLKRGRKRLNATRSEKKCTLEIDEWVEKNIVR